MKKSDGISRRLYGEWRSVDSFTFVVHQFVIWDLYVKAMRKNTLFSELNIRKIGCNNLKIIDSKTNATKNHSAKKTNFSKEIGERQWFFDMIISCV